MVGCCVLPWRATDADGVFAFVTKTSKEAEKTNMFKLIGAMVVYGFALYGLSRMMEDTQSWHGG
jgi:hypothetical protein